MSPLPLVLIGGGGHCAACIDVIEAAGAHEIVGIVDQPSLVGEEVASYPIIGSDKDLPDLIKKYKYLHISLGKMTGGSDFRSRLFEQLRELGAVFPTIISPNAYVSPTCSVGSGSIIMHGAILNANCIIGANCIVNSLALVEHDVEVGDHCHVSTRATLNGKVIVGQDSFIGSGAIVIQGMVIESGVTIGAGAVVVHSLIRSDTYVGVPAKPIGK